MMIAIDGQHQEQFGINAVRYFCFQNGWESKLRLAMGKSDFLGGRAAVLTAWNLHETYERCYQHIEVCGSFAHDLVAES